MALAKKTHKRFSASAMERTIACPRWVVESEGIPETESQQAAEGTVAHALADVAFEAFQAGATEKPSAFHAAEEAGWRQLLDRYIADFGISEDPEAVIDEMCDNVQIYLDYCFGLITTWGTDAVWTPEEQIEMDRLDPECGGTTDFRIYSPSLRKVAIVDFKYGKGKKVSVSENPQAMTYALGTLMKMHNQPIDEVLVAVVQPRIYKEPQVWLTDRVEILAFGTTVREAIAKAKDPSTPLVAGDHCAFCPRRPTCATYRKHALGDILELYGTVKDHEDGIPDVTMAAVEKLTPRQLARIRRLADTLRDWIKAVDEYAYKEAIAGRIPPGLKLVEKRAYRFYTDPDMAKRALLEVFKLSEDDVAPRKMVTVAQAEKLVGKKLFSGRKLFGGDKTLADYTVKKSSGYNLVPEDDPRPSVVRESAADVFSDQAIEV